MPGWQLQQLIQFRAVYEHGSLSAAARALGVSQPALSRALAKLEEELGAALFQRHTGPCGPPNSPPNCTVRRAGCCTKAPGWIVWWSVFRRAARAGCGWDAGRSCRICCHASWRGPWKGPA
ncbi:LysR family transcriptional regulator [Alcanivorax sp. IO_7]|nr:LysR family transcriptional regulator [Alcanivorax sp. IO_7]